MGSISHPRLLIFLAGGIAAVLASFVVTVLPGTGQAPQNDLAGGYATQVQPLLKKYCLDCHSTKVKKGSLDLERFASLAHIRKDLKPWQQVIERLEAGEMPPKEKPQPTADERKRLIAWVGGFLDAEARSRTGDPGRVPLRRLSNAEYDCTIRDLTGVDLRPTREFPADGAAGEGFTNAAESLSDITPALFTKYLNAAKDVADHVLLLPDGFRFAPARPDATGPTKAWPASANSTRDTRAMAASLCNRTCSPPCGTARLWLRESSLWPTLRQRKKSIRNSWRYCGRL